MPWWEYWDHENDYSDEQVSSEDTETKDLREYQEHDDFIYELYNHLLDFRYECNEGEGVFLSNFYQGNLDKFLSNYLIKN